MAFIVNSTGQRAERLEIRPSTQYFLHRWQADRLLNGSDQVTDELSGSLVPLAATVSPEIS